MKRMKTERMKKEEELYNRILCYCVYRAGIDVHFVLIKPHPVHCMPPKHAYINRGIQGMGYCVKYIQVIHSGITG